MGGSGGGFFYRRTAPTDIIKKIQKEKENNVDAEFDAEVNSVLNELLSAVNHRDQEKIQQRLNSIFKSLESEVEGAIDLRYGGSVAKHTYVDGLSDIDALAIINKTELSDKSPAEVKQYFYNQLQQRYPNSEIQIGKLAVTIRFTDGMELQILPAIKASQGIKIPSSREETGWSSIINPERFAKLLRLSNQKLSGKLVPLIKVAKSIIADLPENRRISGYHTEALAINVMSNYDGSNDIKSMLKHLFSRGSARVLTPIVDNTGQSTHVDEYLGAHNSLTRKMISDSFASIARKMENGDSMKSLRYWRDILNI